MALRSLRRPWIIELGRWLGFLVLSWVVLRPALLIAISGDDLINPFFVYDRYGSNPARVAWRATRDVFDNGHFNVVGQVFGAWVFNAWNYLITSGVRFSLIYATTKYVVIVGAVLAAARLLRTLGSLLGWTTTPWRARVVVAAVVLPLLQIHVAWGSDPVASFPLYGYLPALLGLLALDVAIRALQRADVRSAVLAAAALCLTILYYELNVAIVVALVPVAVLLAVRTSASWRPIVRRSVLIAGPPTLMSLVLIVVAKHTNKGYTGTDVEVGGVTVGLVGRTVGGSLPASAWGAAHDWLAGSFGLTRSAVVTAIIVGVALCWAVWRTAPPAPRTPWWQVALVAAVPAVVWLAATLIQTVTSRIDVTTSQLGYVYTYYAYGSIGVALVAIIVVRAVPASPWWRRARPLFMAVAVVFVVVQISVNDTVWRAFDTRLAVIPELTTTISSRPPEAERCRRLDEWITGTSILPDYYHQSMIDGLNVTYHDRFGELFCSSP